MLKVFGKGQYLIHQTHKKTPFAGGFYVTVFFDFTLDT